jgi:hypothetical protein
MGSYVLECAGQLAQKVPKPALICTSMRSLLVGLDVQAWWHLSSVFEVLSDGMLWASGGHVF